LPRTVSDIIRKLSPARRKKVEARAAQLIAEEKAPDDIPQKIERAFEQFERGEFFSAEESRADMEKRKADWLAKRP